MAFEIPKIKYTGKIRRFSWVRGRRRAHRRANCYPSTVSRATCPMSEVAFEVWTVLRGWQQWAIEPYGDVLSDPVAGQGNASIPTEPR
jgi:hypothetical protein